MRPVAAPGPADGSARPLAFHYSYIFPEAKVLKVRACVRRGVVWILSRCLELSWGLRWCVFVCTGVSLVTGRSARDVVAVATGPLTPTRTPPPLHPNPTSPHHHISPRMSCCRACESCRTSSAPTPRPPSPPSNIPRTSHRTSCLGSTRQAWETCRTSPAPGPPPSWHGWQSGGGCCHAGRASRLRCRQG